MCPDTCRERAATLPEQRHAVKEYIRIYNLDKSGKVAVRALQRRTQLPRTGNPIEITPQMIEAAAARLMECLPDRIPADWPLRFAAARDVLAAALGSDPESHKTR
jgi:hypothetical protein